MNPRDLNRAELVDFTTNTATGLANGKVGGFSAAQNTALSDAMTDANAELAAARLNYVEARAAALEAFDVLDAKHKTVLDLHTDVRLLMAGSNSLNSEYEALGYDAPDTTRTAVVPNRPTDLVVTAYLPGVNTGKFKGNNKSQSVTYVVECKIGDTAPFVIVVTTTSQKFRHEGIVAGQFYEYRVRAQSARGVVSDWSNHFVVYGI